MRENRNPFGSFVSGSRHQGRHGAMPMKRNIAKLAGFALVLASGGLLFAWSGLYNVAATAGHWPVTAWLLHFTMRNSVETHAMPLDAPPLDDPALLERGAGHYETGCAPCHGLRLARQPIQQHAPEPPYRRSAGDWTPRSCSGSSTRLKYTGMPAGRRKTAMTRSGVTAFLSRSANVGEDMRLAKGAGTELPVSAERERKLPETPGEIFTLSDAALIGACVRCHGIDGGGRPSGAFPRLDVQSPDYLARALEEYASGVRPSGIMQPVAAALDGSGIERLARHYSEQSATAPVRAAEAERDLLELGRRIAAEGFSPTWQIAACSLATVLEVARKPLFPVSRRPVSRLHILQLHPLEGSKARRLSYSRSWSRSSLTCPRTRSGGGALLPEPPARQGEPAADPEIAQRRSEAMRAGRRRRGGLAFGHGETIMAQ